MGTVTFKVDQRFVGRKMLLFVVLAAVILAMLGWASSVVPLQELRILFIVAAIVFPVEIIVVHFLIPRTYHVGESEIVAKGILVSRTIRPDTARPCVIAKMRCSGARLVCLCSPKGRIYLHSVTDSEAFCRILQERFCTEGQLLVPRSKTYRGLRVMFWIFAAFFAFLPLSVIVLIAAFGAFDDPRDVLFTAITLVPSLPFILLMLLFSTARLERKEEVIQAVGGLRLRPKRLRISGVTINTSFGTSIEGDQGRLGIPLASVLDASLYYDVFAISSGNYEFVDEHSTEQARL
jgi:hypothetical protein